MAQFNKKKSVHLWWNLVYQSNVELNEEIHNKAKILIAEIILTRCKLKVVEIHSYIHGNLIFSTSVDPRHIDTYFNKVVEELTEPLAKHTPKLLFNISLVGVDTSYPRTTYMYIEGDDNMDENFLKSIKHLLEP